MSTWLRISLGSRREQGHRAGYGVIYSGLALGWLVMTSSACLTIEGDGGTTCSDGDPVCSGGEVTTFDVTERAFGEAAEGIEREDRPFFQEGRRLFRARWGRIGQAPPDLDGLGPVFNDDSCEGCHARDGRSAPELAMELGWSTDKTDVLAADAPGVVPADATDALSADALSAES